MAITSVIGGQWGDEGKGKIVDYLSDNTAVVARFQGGANAGHTVYVDEQKFVLHQVPSGILRPDCKNILGAGMVVDPVELEKELDMLLDAGIDITGRVFISLQAHIVTPLHKSIDCATEDSKKNPIGTTRRGIGPAYTDKARRIGLRAHDLLDNDLSARLENRLQYAIAHRELGDTNAEDVRREFPAFLKSVGQLKPFIADTFSLLHRASISDGNILLEGAQGTLLDIDFGTYPYVTSSNPGTGGVMTGLGFPQTKIDRSLGVFKAYVTRVGNGPFPTELGDSVGNYLAERGKEFGATTGRSRRCGWFDAPAARYSCQLNGLSEIALTKLDVLKNLESIKICSGYNVNGKIVEDFSTALHNLENAEPVYESVPGWNTDMDDVDDYSNLPNRAKQYIGLIEELVDTTIKIVSIGPERNQIVVK